MLNRENNFEKILKIKEKFPILRQKINGHKLIYADNAATTQLPEEVIDEILKHYKNNNSNVHRGIHYLSEESTNLLEASREFIANFINSKREEVVFTSGATESLNTIAFGLNLKKGDEVIISKAEHHSNIIPWIELKDRIGIKLKYIDLNEKGDLDFEDFKKKITNKTKVLSITHCSNVIGRIQEIEKFIGISKKKEIITIIDASQSIAHIRIDVKKLDCDFLVFSGHKMFAPSGVGFLYGKIKNLEFLRPLKFGGGMIDIVEEEKFKMSQIPFRFEAGTPNISGIIASKKSFEFFLEMSNSGIEEYEKNLTKYFIEKIKGLSENFKFIGDLDTNKKIPLFSFYHKHINYIDFVEFLNEYGIAVRGGLHCASQLHRKLSCNGSVRISLNFYNNTKEIDRIFSALIDIERRLS